MNLNDIEYFKKIDSSNMITRINNLPDQLHSAYKIGLDFGLPKLKSIDKVLISGMGGSAIGADLLKAYAETKSTSPIIIYRDYQLPKWADSENTLVICTSHSGNTEETLSVFQDALNAECHLMAISTGGKLEQQSKEHGVPHLLFEDDFVPRAAVGYGFGLLLAVIFRLNLIPDPKSDVENAVEEMKDQQKELLPEVEVTQNSAKRMAGQFMGRWITIFGGGFMAPVARRWKCQINEIAKAQASFEALPEASHNTIEGIQHPETSFNQSMAIWLRAPANHPRNLLRDEFTRMSTMVNGVNTDFVMAKGNTVLSNMWTSLHYGDYTSYYLAMAYGVDPTPTPMLEELKQNMTSSS